MRHCFFIVVLILATGAFISCQKEISADTPGVSVVPASDSFIVKILEIDSLTKDSTVFYFDYDNLKRVTTIRQLEQGYPMDTLYSFYYTGNATLPFKTTHHPYNDEWFHVYNAQNKLILDSLSDLADTGHIIYNSRNYKTEEFSYATDKIIIKTSHHWHDASSQTHGVIPTTDTSLINTAGNILFTRFNYFKETATQTYNTRPNPIAKLNIFPALHPYGFYEADETFIQSPNLWITGYQSSQQTTLYTNDIRQFNITYNTDGYPARSVISLSQTGGPVFYWNRYYYYKKL